jgi:hypothetical protein
MINKIHLREAAEDAERETYSAIWDYSEMLIGAADYIEKLEKALEIYSVERDRFKHNKPEITGAYFLTGGHGDIDKNLLPQFVRVCPAYGAGWEQVYEKTDRTVTLEGS